MKRQRLIPVILVPIVGVLVATTSFADDKPVNDRQHPATPGVTAAFSGPRWEQPETEQSAGAPHTLNEQLWTVDVRALDRSSSPVDGVSYSIYDLETGTQVVFGRTGQGAPVRLPAGRYAAQAMVTTPATDTGATRTMVVLPEVAVTADTAVVFDARAGREVSVALDEPRAQQVSAAVFVYQRAGNGRLIKHGISAQSFSGTIYVTPTSSHPDLTAYVYTVWTRPDLPDVYNLMSRSRGRVPDELSYRFRTTDLTAVRVRYAAQAVRSCGGTYIGPHLAGAPSPLAYGTTFPLPTQRTEFYSPDEAQDVAWYTEFAQTTADCSFEEYDTQTSRPTRYPRPGRRAASWNTAPLTPSTATGVDGQPAAVRQGDTMSIGIPMYVDSQPGHTNLGEPYTAATGAVRLLQGERVIAESPTLDRLTCQVPSELTTYRLTTTAERTVGWSTLATRTDTTWTFRSRSTKETQALPLINARYRLPLDDYNRAPTDVPIPLVIQLEHQLPIVHTRLFISYDEGGTWQPVALTGSGKQRRATLRHQTGGPVSLRLEAGDSAGNSINQTLIRAYVVE